MGSIKVQNSAVTNSIYAGSVGKNNLWGKNKTDVTIECLCAVASHVEKFGEPVVISTIDGKPEYKITVEKL